MAAQQRKVYHLGLTIQIGPLSLLLSFHMLLCALLELILCQGFDWCPLVAVRISKWITKSFDLQFSSWLFITPSFWENSILMIRRYWKQYSSSCPPHTRVSSLHCCLSSLILEQEWIQQKLHESLTSQSTLNGGQQKSQEQNHNFSEIFFS